MSNDVRYSYGGPGFWGWLTILFIGLKLAGVINWSWWWVLAPMWIGLALFGIIAFLVLIIAAIASRA